MNGANSDHRIFYMDKTNWYHTSESGVRSWSAKNQIQNFWYFFIREKLNKNDYDFSNIIFPEFTEDSPFFNEEQLNITGTCYFNEAKFLGKTVFNNVFFNKILFSHAEFEGDFTIKRCSFRKSVVFSKSTFYQSLRITGSTFVGIAGFKNNSLKKDFWVKKNDFRSYLNIIKHKSKRIVITESNKVQLLSISQSTCNDVLLHSSEFSNIWLYRCRLEKLSINNSKIIEASDITDCIFDENLLIEKSKFYKFNFTNNESKHTSLISDCTFGDETTIELNKLSNCEILDFHFKGVTSFELNEFKGEFLKFENGIVDKNIDFRDTRFSCNSLFQNTLFKDRVNFYQATFSKPAIFKVEFNSEAIFESIKIDEHLLDKSSYYGLATFKDACFNGNAVYDNCLFEGELVFSDILLNINNKIEFSRTKFSSKNLNLFQKLNPKGQIIFEQVVLSEKVQFLDCDFSNIAFDKSSIIKATFSNCYYPRERFSKRIKFYNENYSKEELIVELTDSKKDLIKEKQIMIGEFYRQLKLNQMQAKNWGDAGDAYRSEMVIKRKLIFNRFKSGEYELIFSWIIMLIYGCFSGYQQSISKPIVWLILTWLGFATFLNYYQPILGFNEAMSKSFVTIFPLSGKIDTAPFADHFYIKLVVERLLSVILLTFFVFSIRSRLKQ